MTTYIAWDYLTPLLKMPEHQNHTNLIGTANNSFAGQPYFSHLQTFWPAGSASFGPIPSKIVISSVKYKLRGIAPVRNLTIKAGAPSGMACAAAALFDGHKEGVLIAIRPDLGNLLALT